MDPLFVGQFVGAQFPKKLRGYADSLVKYKSRFQIAMVIQIARDSEKIGMWPVFSPAIRFHWCRVGSVDDGG